jgi:hypothetical protein
MARDKRFRTRQQVERYFAGNTIECLLCGRWFQKLINHLFYKHGMSADEYKGRFGLPWRRGLVSAKSRSRIVASWTKARREKTRQIAKRERLFDRATHNPRQWAPFLQRELLDRNRRGSYGEEFERRVRALFDRGLIDREIATRLKVSRMTVNLRTRQWR